MHVTAPSLPPPPRVSFSIDFLQHPPPVQTAVPRPGQVHQTPLQSVHQSWKKQGMKDDTNGSPPFSSESVQSQNIGVFGHTPGKADTNTFSEESPCIALPLHALIFTVSLHTYVVTLGSSASPYSLKHLFLVCYLYYLDLTYL